MLIYFFAACDKSGASVETYFTKKDGTTTPKVIAELAKTEGERRLGLMYRKEMPEDRGMLFIFPTERPQSFWMKNTYLELDIIYLSSEWKVVTIIHRAVPLSETARPSVTPAQYVLEVVGGLSEKWGISKGDKLEIVGGLAAITDVFLCSCRAVPRPSG